VLTGVAKGDSVVTARLRPRNRDQDRGGGSCFSSHCSHRRAAHRILRASQRNTGRYRPGRRERRAGTIAGVLVKPTRAPIRTGRRAPARGDRRLTARRARSRLPRRHVRATRIGGQSVVFSGHCFHSASEHTGDFERSSGRWEVPARTHRIRSDAHGVRADARALAHRVRPRCSAYRRPSCFSRPSVLAEVHSSAILPSTKRKIAVPLTSTFRPVAGMPLPVPVFVPRASSGRRRDRPRRR